MLYVRGNFFIPDARVGWVKPSVKFLAEYIPQNNIEVIITTGPPHSLHLIGKRLKEKIGIKWIADFRDPWTTIHYHKSLQLSTSAEKKHKNLEAEVLQKADSIVVTSPTTKKEFESITEVPIEVITNGYDVSLDSDIPLDQKFSLSHIGSLLSERNPVLLWKVLSVISQENKSFENDLQLKFAGAVSEEVKESLQYYGLLNATKILGYVSHSEAIRLQRQSQVLLLVEIDSTETRAIIPGKLFEYLAARRPIISLGPKGSDIEFIIDETATGKFFDYSQERELKLQILRYYDTYRNENLDINPHNIQKYSRKALTEKMSHWINKNT